MNLHLTAVTVNGKKALMMGLKMARNCIKINQAVRDIR